MPSFVPSRGPVKSYQDYHTFPIIVRRYATTDPEVVFAICTELVMGLIFGLLAGTMSSVLTTAKVSEQLYKSRMNELNEFLRFKKCPRILNTWGVSSFNDSNKYK